MCIRDRHEPEEEIDEEQKSTYAKRLADDAISWYKHCLLHWMHGYALQLKGQNYHLENVNWSVNNLRGQSTFKSRRKRTGKTINSSGTLAYTFNTDKRIALFDTYRLQIRGAPTKF